MSATTSDPTLYASAVPGQDVPRSPWRLTAVAGVGALLVTLGVVGLPFLSFAYRAPTLHVALETSAALVALVVAYLVRGRFQSSRSLQELLLATGLGLVAITNLVLAVLPPAFAIADVEELRRWGAVALRLLGTLTIAAAALTPADRQVSRRNSGWIGLAAVGAAVAALTALLLFADGLPPLVDPSIDLGDAGRPAVVGHPLVLVSQALGAIAYAVAAVAFTRQAGRRPDELVRWLGAACALAAASRVNYFLFPSLYSDYVYTGDLLRFGFYVLLLIGAAREVQSFWTARAEAAVLEDRRRLARDLHDGLTQELSYIWAQSGQLAKRPGDPAVVERISGAAGRALDESRRAIAALTRPLDEGFDVVLRQQVEQMASRYDVEAVVDLAPDARVAPQQGEELLRITGEAFRNAVRHGRASYVRVRLEEAPLRLVVQDDGQGFDVSAAKTATGFGLVSMRERAEGMGAQLVVSSEPASGTTVEVVWT